ncbi:MAG: hypothetical protein AB7G12_13605 [Thermoanaerobaculia bacterium]
MSYPGDPALALDVQQRILTTFQQTLDLASKGNRQEALLGCDFILRLDPQFGPARTLQQLVNAGHSGPELTELLGPKVAPTPAAPAPPAGDLSVDELFGGVDRLNLDLPASPFEERPSGSSTLESQLLGLLEKRDFAAILKLAEANRREVSANGSLRKLVEQAHGLLEAEPYVSKFLESARQAMQSGEKEEAASHLAKARSLDPGHPEIARIEEAQAFYDDPDRSMGSRRRGIQMEDPLEGGAPIEPVGGADASLDLPEVDFSLGSGGFDDGADDGQLGVAAPNGENADRIQELLGEGQRAFERGEYQSAIDAWSRIFLIDIDHHEAARRIEQARQLKAEREREVEELFHGGVEKFDSADFDAAESAFRKVLEIAPGYVLAREYLEKIEERRAGSLPPAVAAASAKAAGAADAAGAARRAPTGAREAASREILVPPEPGARRRSGEEERPAYAVAAKRRGGPSSSFLVIGGAVLALLLAGGWLLVKNRARLFPNAKEPVASPAPAQADPLARARALHADGKTAIALAQLRRLPPTDSHYAEAQSLISQWEALVTPADPVPAGPSPEVKAKRDALIAAAEKACRESEYLSCRRLLDKAANLLALEPSLDALSAQANQGIAPLAKELKLYDDGEFDMLLNQLWRKHEAEPGNRDVKRLIVDSYFNLGLLELQRGDPAAAADRFREARKLDPADAELDRVESFAIAYTQKPDDLLFQIFVRNLGSR